MPPNVLLFLLSLFSCSALAAPPEGFVYPAERCPNIIVEARYYTSYNFVGERIDGYRAPQAILAKEAAAALCQAAASLQKQGYAIKIFDAYRPQRAVSHFKRWAQNVSDTRMKSIFYPNEDKQFLFKRGYIASRSGHSRGSTVDLTLFDRASGKEVDMGGPFDLLDNRSHHETQVITERQRKNRAILCKAMEDAGFVRYSKEWWHYTLKNEPYPNTYFDFPVE